MEIYYKVQEEKWYSNVYGESPACSFIPSGKYCGKSQTFLRGPYASGTCLSCDLITLALPDWAKAGRLIQRSKAYVMA